MNWKIPGNVSFYHLPLLLLVATPLHRSHPAYGLFRVIKALSHLALLESDKYKGGCSQPANHWSESGIQMEELEKGLEDLRGFAATWG